MTQQKITKTVATKKNIAVVGCGYWGKNLVRNFYELGVLKTICDESEVTLKGLFAKYQGIHCVRNINDVLADPSIEGMVIAAPAAITTPSIEGSANTSFMFLTQ